MADPVTTLPVDLVTTEPAQAARKVRTAPKQRRPAKIIKRQRRKHKRPGSKAGAPKGNKRALGNIGGYGDPIKYQKQFATIVKALAEKGATNAEMVIALGISRATFHQWRSVYTEFSKSIERGKYAYDERVVESLAERAIGYDYVAEKVVTGKHGSSIVRYVEHVTADVGAAKFWLANRQPKEWSESYKLAHVPDEGTPLSRLYAEICGRKFTPVE